MLEDADDYAVTRHLEAYLLWLFGWIMFTNSHGNSVLKELIHCPGGCKCSDRGGSTVQLGFRGAGCDVPRSLRRVLEDKRGRDLHRLSASAAALVVRAILDWTTVA